MTTQTDKSVFEKIADGELPSWKIWEDDTYVAFLSLFASTPGMTIVIPKKNPGGYVFALEDDAIAGLMRAAKKVANLLEKALGVPKVALVFEGEAVQHTHAKLYPMHDLDADRSAFPQLEVFFPKYPGYIQTSSGPKLSDADLDAMQAKIKQAADS